MPRVVMEKSQFQIWRAIIGGKLVATICSLVSGIFFSKWGQGNRSENYIYEAPPTQAQ